MKLSTLFSLVAASALLSACGGGGGGTAAPAAVPVAGPVEASDKFVGSWAHCDPVTGAANGVLSAKTVFVYTKTGATTLNLSVDGAGYKAANCAGTAFNSITGVATAGVTLNGTKLIGTQTVERLDMVGKSATITALNGNLKDIALVTATTMQFGASSVPDANGYPTVIDTTAVFAKQ
jgi:hypothetical protein